MIAVRKLVEQLREHADRVLTGNGLPVVSFSHSPTGLGGQISRRVFALRYGMLNNIRPVFEDENFFPYKFCYTNEPYSSKSTEIDQRFDFWEFWENEPKRADFFRKVPTYWPTEIPKVHFDTLINGIAMETFVLTEQYEQLVRAHRMKLRLPEEYIGVHFRRGDKHVETPYVPARLFRDELVKLSNRTGIRDVFVASDHPKALQELDLGNLGFNLYFDEDERRLNNANHKYLLKRPEEAEAETATAICNIYTLAGAAALIGQDNAHFATLAAGAIATKRQTLETILLLDGRIQLRTPYWKAIYAATSWTRNTVKGLVGSKLKRVENDKRNR